MKIKQEIARTSLRKYVKFRRSVNKTHNTLYARKRLRDRRLDRARGMSQRYRLARQVRWYKYLNFIFHIRTLGVKNQ